MLPQNTPVWSRHQDNSCTSHRKYVKPLKGVENEQKAGQWSTHTHTCSSFPAFASTPTPSLLFLGRLLCGLCAGWYTLYWAWPGALCTPHTRPTCLVSYVMLGGLGWFGKLYHFCQRHFDKNWECWISLQIFSHARGGQCIYSFVISFKWEKDILVNQWSMWI